MTEFLKGLIFILLTHISSYEFNSTFILFIGSLLFFLLIDNDSINNSYFMAGMGILGLLCITSFPGNFNPGVIIVGFSVLMIYWYFDNTYFKEEYSLKKIYFRLLGLLGTIVVLIIRFAFLNTTYFDTALMSSIGYSLVSVINMTFLYFQKEGKVSELEEQKEN